MYTNKLNFVPLLPVVNLNYRSLLYTRHRIGTNVSRLCLRRDQPIYHPICGEGEISCTDRDMDA